MSYLLALDASTSQVGYCIFDKSDKSLKKIGHWTPPDGEIIDKALAFSDWLKWLLNEITNTDGPSINEMVIEESLKAFAMGRSSADVIIKLSQINVLYRYICQTEFKMKVHTITSHNARKFAFPTFQFKKKQVKNEKEQAFDLVLTELGSSCFDTKVITRGKNKGVTVYEGYCYDMSDAYCVGKGYLNLK